VSILGDVAEDKSVIAGSMKLSVHEHQIEEGGARALPSNGLKQLNWKR
jgi:hypothetical protein